MKDWVIHYIKAKDVFTKSLKNYNIKEDIIEFDFGNHKQFYLLIQNLNKEIIEKAKSFDKKTLVCEKNPFNLKFLIENFKELSEIQDLKIIFLSKDKNSKFLLLPKAHAKIADPESLEQGIKTLWNNS